MTNLKVHHIGYLVKKIQQAIGEFQHLGYQTVSEVTHDQYRNIHI